MYCKIVAVLYISLCLITLSNTDIYYLKLYCYQRNTIIHWGSIKHFPIGTDDIIETYSGQRIKSRDYLTNQLCELGSHWSLYSDFLCVCVWDDLTQIYFERPFHCNRYLHKYLLGATSTSTNHALFRSLGFSKAVLLLMFLWKQKTGSLEKKYKERWPTHPLQLLGTIFRRQFLGIPPFYCLGHFP